MSTSDEQCTRCGGSATTRDNLVGSTFNGWVQREQETTETRHLRVIGHYIRMNSNPSDTRVYRTDDREALCGDCWGLLADFLQGRPVPAAAKS